MPPVMATIFILVPEVRPSVLPYAAATGLACAPEDYLLGEREIECQAQQNATDQGHGKIVEGRR
jgi:hypothetical protein